MKKLLNLLNSKESFENFGNNYGKIKDKSLAIDLLCKTPYAWYALDESLQKDAEVIMYYQPIGIVRCTYEIEPYTISARQYEDEVGVQPMYESDLVVRTENDIAIQKGFIHASRKPEFGDLMFQRYGYNYQLPNIDLPEGFNKNMYFEIQKGLIESGNAEEIKYFHSREQRVYKNGKVIAKSFEDNNDFINEYNIGAVERNINFINPIEYIKISYDRSKLATIVAEVTKSFEEKGKQAQLQ